MDKNKYLKEFEKRLKYLNDNDKASEIFEMSNKLDSGKDIKDLSTAVSEVYAKYNIDENEEIKKEKILKEKEEKKKNKKSKKMPGILGHFQNFYLCMCENNYKENIIIIRDLVLILIVASLLKIPFIFINTVTFQILGESLSTKFFDMMNIILEILYIGVALAYLNSRIKKRFKKELDLE